MQWVDIRLEKDVHYFPTLVEQIPNTIIVNKWWDIDGQ